LLRDPAASFLPPIARISPAGLLLAKTPLDDVGKNLPDQKCGEQLKSLEGRSEVIP
jgi:hypothetical protein